MGCIMMNLRWPGFFLGHFIPSSCLYVMLGICDTFSHESHVGFGFFHFLEVLTLVVDAMASLLSVSSLLLAGCDSHRKVMHKVSWVVLINTLECAQLR